MMAKSVGWTTGGSPSHPDSLEFDINNMRPDEVLVRIDVQERSRSVSIRIAATKIRRMGSQRGLPWRPRSRYGGGRRRAVVRRSFRDHPCGREQVRKLRLRPARQIGDVRRPRNHRN